MHRQVNARPIAQPAIAVHIQRLHVGLGGHAEALFVGKAGVLLAVEAALGPIIDMHGVDVGIHHAAERRLPIDFLHGQDIGVKEAYVAADALIIDGRPLLLSAQRHLEIGNQRHEALLKGTLQRGRIPRAGRSPIEAITPLARVASVQELTSVFLDVRNK